MDWFGELGSWLAGSGEGDAGALQMSVRALIVFAGALVLVRVGEKRFLGKNSAFDVILGIVLGSTMSRAINGDAPFLPSVAAGGVLVGLHYLLAGASYRWSRFGSLVKGRPRELIRDGEVRRDEMKAADITEDDLKGSLRLRGRVTSPEEAEEAWLERGGVISVIPKRRAPQVLEVQVADGVQTVRIRLE